MDLRTQEMSFARQWGLSFNLIRSEKPDMTTNCHGWVFGAGRYWINGEQVEHILAENDYQVNLKSELGIQALIKGQAELIARVGLLERQVTPSRRPGAVSVSGEEA